jgi:hypothetical protein
MDKNNEQLDKQNSKQNNGQLDEQNSEQNNIEIYYKYSIKKNGDDVIFKIINGENNTGANTNLYTKKSELMKYEYYRNLFNSGMKESKINEDGFYIIEITDFSVDTIILFLRYENGYYNNNYNFWYTDCGVFCEYLIFCDKYFIDCSSFKKRFIYNLQNLEESIDTILYRINNGYKDPNSFQPLTYNSLTSILFKCGHFKRILDVLIKQNLWGIIRFAYMDIYLMISKISEIIQLAYENSNLELRELKIKKDFCYRRCISKCEKSLSSCNLYSYKYLDVDEAYTSKIKEWDKVYEITTFIKNNNTWNFIANI